MTSYGPWIDAAWPALSRGARVRVSGLPHPIDAGFVRPALSRDVGQVADYVAPLPDGSRLHVHEMPDGELVAHRDRFDPARGPLHAAAHAFLETAPGRVAGLGTVLFTIARVLL